MSKIKIKTDDIFDYYIENKEIIEKEDKFNVFSDVFDKANSFLITGSKIAKKIPLQRESLNYILQLSDKYPNDYVFFQVEQTVSKQEMKKIMPDLFLFPEDLLQPFSQNSIGQKLKDNKNENMNGNNIESYINGERESDIKPEENESEKKNKKSLDVERINGSGLSTNNNTNSNINSKNMREENNENGVIKMEKNQENQDEIIYFSQKSNNKMNKNRNKEIRNSTPVALFSLIYIILFLSGITCLIYILSIKIDQDFIIIFSFGIILFLLVTSMLGVIKTTLNKGSYIIIFIFTILSMLAIIGFIISSVVKDIKIIRNHFWLIVIYSLTLVLCFICMFISILLKQYEVNNKNNDDKKEVLILKEK